MCLCTPQQTHSLREHRAAAHSPCPRDLWLRRGSGTARGKPHLGSGDMHALVPRRTAPHERCHALHTHVASSLCLLGTCESVGGRGRADGRDTAYPWRRCRQAPAVGGIQQPQSTRGRRRTHRPRVKISGGRGPPVPDRHAMSITVASCRPPPPRFSALQLSCSPQRLRAAPQHHRAARYRATAHRMARAPAAWRPACSTARSGRLCAVARRMACIAASEGSVLQYSIILRQ